MLPCFEEHVLRAAADGKAANRGGLGKREVIRAIWRVTGLGSQTVRRAPGRAGRRAGGKRVQAAKAPATIGRCPKTGETVWIHPGTVGGSSGEYGSGPSAMLRAFASLPARRPQQVKRQEDGS